MYTYLSSKAMRKELLTSKLLNGPLEGYGKSESDSNVAEKMNKLQLKLVNAVGSG